MQNVFATLLKFIKDDFMPLGPLNYTLAEHCFCSCAILCI